MIPFVTGNENKKREFRELLPSNIEVDFKDLDLLEIQGDPIAVAKAKCSQAAQLVTGPVITEDTCLCFNALGGLPGPYMYKFYFNF